MGIILILETMADKRSNGPSTVTPKTGGASLTPISKLYQLNHAVFSVLKIKRFSTPWAWITIILFENTASELHIWLAWWELHHELYHTVGTSLWTLNSDVMPLKVIMQWVWSDLLSIVFWLQREQGMEKLRRVVSHKPRARWNELQ